MVSGYCAEDCETSFKLSMRLNQSIVAHAGFREYTTTNCTGMTDTCYASVLDVDESLLGCSVLGSISYPPIDPLRT
jgi:hypothetical protein